MHLFCWFGCFEFIPAVCICSEGGMSPVPQSDSNGGTTINEILHETAKYVLTFYIRVLLIIARC